VISRFKDRISAKLAFHDPTRYRALVHQAMESAGVSLASPATIHKLRRLDPDGLGIWYLARGGRQPLLADLCRKAIALPGLGPPRAIARALDRAWSGEKTCLFGESTGFDALMAASLIGAGHAATLVAAHLAWPDGANPLSSAANQLTRTASAVQSAGRAYARVGRSGSPAQETTRWLFQAVNLLRRALNHTDLMAVDEQIARESARESLAAASAACAAALNLSTDCQANEVSEGGAAREKLAAIARTMDALASRVAVSLRTDSPPLSSQNFLIEQSTRVLTDTIKSLRPWHIELQCATMTSESADIQNFCTRANDLAEASADVLDSWAVLHELFSVGSSGSAGPERRASQSTPLWAERLVRAIGQQWSCEDVVSALRAVAGRSEQAVTLAVELSVLHGSLQLSRELWRLIRASRSIPLERSLAFQLFLRTDNQ
jgi:hypothetical protein